MTSRRSYFGIASSRRPSIETGLHPMRETPQFPWRGVGHGCFRAKETPSTGITALKLLRAGAILLRQFKLCLPVQSLHQKYFDSHPRQITCLSVAVSSHWRGGSRSSRTRGGMRWTRMALETKALEADGEAVWS
jgi:hypothetical protein